MQCNKCGSNNVNVQAVSITKSKKHHGIVYWIFIGWWLEPIMWLFLTLPWLIIKIFKPNKVKTKVKGYAVCQDCGNRWQV